MSPSVGRQVAFHWSRARTGRHCFSRHPFGYHFTVGKSFLIYRKTNAGSLQTEPLFSWRTVTTAGPARDRQSGAVKNGPITPGRGRRADARDWSGAISGGRGQMRTGGEGIWGKLRGGDGEDLHRVTSDWKVSLQPIAGKVFSRLQSKFC